MNYEKTKIYRIDSHLGDKIYIGSTAKEYLSQRFQQHKLAYKRWKDGRGRKVTSYELFELYGIDNCQIVLIEAIPCQSKDEKNAKESYYIRTMECVNKVVPDRSRNEYNQLERVKEYKKEYYQTNIEHHSQQMKEYYQKNSEHIQEYQVKYNKDNADAIKIYQREYYQKKKALQEATNAN